MKVSLFLHKSINVHKKNEKCSDQTESRFHRMSHLVSTKSSVTFLQRIVASNVVTPNVAKLQQLLMEELCDITLYLSHKSLHEQIYALSTESDDVSRRKEKFVEVKKLLKSLSQAVKVLQVDHHHKVLSFELILNLQ